MIPILLINLNRDRERLDHMRGEFMRVGLEFERFPGIYGADLTPDLRPYFCDSEGNIVSSLRRGEIGCYASHLAVWRRIVDQDLSPAVLVCEDDIILPDGISELLDRLVIGLSPGWDIVRLSSNPTKAVSPVAPLGNGYRLVRYWKIPPLSGAYLISRAGAEKLLRPGLRQNPIDQDISKPWLFGMDAYGVIPTPVVQNIIKSTIDEIDVRPSRRRPTRVGRLWRKAGKIPRRVRAIGYNLRTMGAVNWLRCIVVNFRHKITARRFEW